MNFSVHCLSQYLRDTSLYQYVNGILSGVNFEIQPIQIMFSDLLRHIVGLI